MVQGETEAQARWIQKNIPVPTNFLAPVIIQKDPKSGEDFTFMPASPSIGSLNFDENMLFWLYMLKLSKTPEGLKQSVDILKDVIKGTTDAIGHLATGAHSGAASAEVNYIAAYASARLTMMYMERFGLLTQVQTMAFTNELIVLTAAAFGKDTMNDVLDVLPKMLQGIGGIFKGMGGLGAFAGLG